MLATRNHDNGRKLAAAIGGFGLIALIGFLDSATPVELSFSTLYIIPIFLLSWATWTWLALVGAFVCVVAWTIADLTSGIAFTLPLSLYWNVGMRLALFAVVASVLSELKKSLDRERSLARIDGLTGAANVRSFMELLRAEADRAARYGRAFTIAYLDLDNFKAVNDSFGHAAGDAVLQTVVAAARKHMRSTDSVARMGGDEFMLLFPELEGRAARAAIDKIRLCIVQEMEVHEWPVTVSIGALTCRDAAADPNRLIKQADDLMYRAKAAGRNTAVYGVTPASG
jgi:diguanylate cyclase (GGDEF)-like protein